MAAKGTHTYGVKIEWTGNRGSGTSGYREYGREHTIAAGSKPDIPGSSDAAFRGNAERWNPEDLLVASASACHKLWYLHLCADAGIACASAPPTMPRSPRACTTTRTPGATSPTR
jgi:organic hydroperoxide reductase OsmC/OhrA